MANASRRTFCLSLARSQEPSNGNPPNLAPRTTRAARASDAFKKITSISPRPPPRQPGSYISPTARGGLREGRFKSGQNVIPRSGNNASTSAASTPRPAAPGNRPIASRGLPEGAKFVRAPSNLRISRVSVGGGASSPARGPPGATAFRNRGPRTGQRSGPKRREFKDKKDNQSGRREVEKYDPAEELSDGMVLQLMRLQSNEWAQKTYEPMYGAGGDAVAELMEAGRRLIAGQPAKEKAITKRILEDKREAGKLVKPPQWRQWQEKGIVVFVPTEARGKQALVPSQLETVPENLLGMMASRGSTFEAAEKQARELVGRGLYEVSELGLKDGEKREDKWVGTATRGLQTNPTYLPTSREKFLEKVSQVMGV